MVNEKFILNLNLANIIIAFPYGNKTKLNFITKLPNRKYFIVATKKYENHFIVTGFETKKEDYIKNIKRRGEVFKIIGRAPYSFITRQSRLPAGLSGVDNLKTSPTDSIADQTKNFNRIKKSEILNLFPDKKPIKINNSFLIESVKGLDDLTEKYQGFQKELTKKLHLLKFL